MHDYLCVSLLSRSGESEADFKARLSELWTHMLRNRESDFEKVYAETSAFEKKGDRSIRKYLVEADIAPALEAELRALGMEYEPIDDEDRYTKFEASPPEWFWIEH